MIAKAEAGSIVAVLGASSKPKQYSYRAVQLLKQHGHKAIPVHPAGHAVDGIPGVKSLDDINKPVDTLTIYVNSRISNELADSILKLNPRRVIFNPGAENDELAKRLDESGIEVVHHCTLVMLHEGLY